MEDEQNGSYQHGRQPKLSKSIKQGLHCDKRNSENGSVVSSLARFLNLKLVNSQTRIVSRITQFVD